MAEKMTPQETAERLMNQEVVSDAALHELLLQSVDDLEIYADAIDESADYLIEAALEAATERPSLLVPLAERVQNYWLVQQTISGCSAYEVTVRAAEFIAAFLKGTGVPDEHLGELADSSDWRQRLICAWAVRHRRDDAGQAIRLKLSSDPFRDDNEIYLVREGAGFADEF